MNRRGGIGLRLGAREQGMATLMAVLFLLIVIAFAVLVATSMSGSDITDTSLGQSGVSALFLAESGVERAAARYVAGTACASLAVDGPYTLGQGSFTINAWYPTDFSGANLPSGECRIQVQGTVGTAQRTVQAILQLPASGFVVGNGGVALQCSGSTCTDTPIPKGTGNLVGVSCPVSTDCIAVTGTGKAIQWNGSVWKKMPSSAVRQYVAVACELGNGNDCFAVGSRGRKHYVLQWNGSAWNQVGSSPSSFTAIACAGTGAGTTCYATTSGNWFWVGNGAGWTRQHTNTAHLPLSAVSCASTTDCWTTESLVGVSWYFDELAPSGGTDHGPYSGGGVALDAISCDALNDCWATGAKNGVTSSTFAYWDGSTWTPRPLTTVKQNLYGIDCLSPTDCWAVGFNGTVLIGSGAGAARTWALVPLPPGVPATTQFNAVSFPADSGSGGSAVVIQWHEIES